MTVWHRLERHRLWWHERRPGGPSRRERRHCPDPSRSPGTDLLPQVRHIVVVMMENHSYDNYLGTLRGRGEGFLLDPEGQPQPASRGAGRELVRPFHLSSTVQHEGVPSQSWPDTHDQWGGGLNDGFTGVGMGYWEEADLPFYHGLARTFPVADRWFSSCLGPTFPNRRFLIAGTAHGLIDDSPCDLVDYPPAGTIFDLLTRHGISWANYHPMAGQQPRLSSYARHSRKMTRRRLLAARRSLRGGLRGVAKDLKFTADVFPLGLGRYMEHIRSTDQFFADAQAGTLPAFSIVDPDFEVYSEENPQDIRKGESFAAEVINRVMRGAGWPGTLLIWLYDEHGGYYDHVPPPAAVEPDDVPARSRLADPGSHRYDRYGFRVPAVIVSPYARRDYVCHTVLDHTSVLRLVEDKWNLPSLTARDAAASSPLEALDLTAPPAFLTPPDLPPPSLAWGSWN
jgi:phospholipase C